MMKTAIFAATAGVLAGQAAAASVHQRHQALHRRDGHAYEGHSSVIEPFHPSNQTADPLCNPTPVCVTYTTTFLGEPTRE